MRIQVYTAPAEAPAPRPKLAGWFTPAQAEQWADQEWRYGRGCGRDGGGETLFRTAGDRWVRGYWTRWEGKRVQWYEFIGEEAARGWLAEDVGRQRLCMPVTAAVGGHGESG